MIIDANAYVGRWPFRRLHYAGANGLAELMQRTGTNTALCTPIAGVFYRDCLSAMEEMLEEPGWDAARMKPVAVINPVFPGWKKDLQTMVKDMHCVAVRLISNYHGYKLYDDAAMELVQQAQNYNLPVIVTIRMQDERSHHWRMLVPAVGCDEVAFIMRQFPHGKYILSNIAWGEVRMLRREMEMTDEAVWEMSYKPPAFFVEEAVATMGAERLLYGSAAPLQYPESLLLPVTEAPISDEAKQAILSENAKRVFEIGG